MRIDVTKEEAELLTDIIDLWVLGVKDAKQLTTEDPTIDSCEQLLDLMSGYDDQVAMLNKVRKMLNPKVPVPKTQEEKIAFRKSWDERYEQSKRHQDG